MLKLTYMFVAKYLLYAISSWNHVSKINISWINELLDNMRYKNFGFCITPHSLLGLSKARPMTLLFSIYHLLKTPDHSTIVTPIKNANSLNSYLMQAMKMQIRCQGVRNDRTIKPFLFCTCKCNDDLYNVLISLFIKK